MPSNAHATVFRWAEQLADQDFSPARLRLERQPRLLVGDVPLVGRKPATQLIGAGDISALAQHVAHLGNTNRKLRRWRAHLTIDEVEFYCPDCAAQEFGDD